MACVAGEGRHIVRACRVGCQEPDHRSIFRLIHRLPQPDNRHRAVGASAIDNVVSSGNSRHKGTPPESILKSLSHRVHESVQRLEQQIVAAL
jgi:hypothetical protein